MASPVTHRLDIKDFSNAPKRLREKVHIANARILKRSAVTTRTFMQRQIAPDMGLPATTVKEAMFTDESRIDSALTVAVGAKGAKIPLIDFKARGPIPTRGRGRGVTAKLNPPGRGKYAKAFIVTMKSGHRGVFERVSPSLRKSVGAWGKNLPLKELHGPSIAKVFGKYEGEGAKVAADALQKNTDHEYKWALQEIAQGS